MAAARRIKYSILLAVVIASGLGFLAATQPWFTITLSAASSHSAAVVVPGSTAAPALTALSLAGLALAGALAIAGRIARIIVAVLGVILGGCIILSAVQATSDPIDASSASVTKATGIAGHASVTHLIAHTNTSIWPAVALAGGVLAVLCSIAVLVTSSTWPGSSRRYQAVRFESADAAITDPSGISGTPISTENARDAAIDSWDDLSRGGDPTTRHPGPAGE